MRWREIDILNERVRDAYLYHAVSSASIAAHILSDNAIKAFTSHRADELGLASTGQDYVRGVSLTRSTAFATGWRAYLDRTGKNVVFALDTNRLRTAFDLRPYNYFAIPDDEDYRSEAEEFCVSPKGIAPLDRFLAAIQMSKVMYDRCREEKDAMVAPLLDHPLLTLI